MTQRKIRNIVCGKSCKKLFLLLLDTGLKMMVAEPSGTKIVFLDAKNQGYVFNPINDTLVLIRNMPPT